MDSPSTMDRVNELFQGSVVPYPFMEFGKVPAFLADFYMNFRRFVWDDGYLDPKTKSLIALAVVVHSHCKAWATWFESVRLPALGLSSFTGSDVRALVATCSMHNAYFKGLDFSHITLVGKTHGLRSHAFAYTGLDSKTVEFICAVISALNGCHRCTNGHVTSAIGSGASDPMIQEAFQCAATMVAGVSFLNSL